MSTQDSLDDLSVEVSALSDERHNPKTSFTLLSKARSEDAWQSYIAYLLDPAETHGLQGRFLKSFLESLVDYESIPELAPLPAKVPSDVVTVQIEYQTSNRNRPDIVIENGSTWYICLELKVESKEHENHRGWQTERYATDQKITQQDIDAYEEGAYVYLKAPDAPPSRSDDFADVSWTDVADCIRSFLGQNATTIPTRTASHLDEFATTIDNQFTMTEIDPSLHKKKDLYFEYREEIRDVEQAIRPFVESVLQQEWGNALEGKFGGEYEPESADEYQWEYSAVGHSYGQVQPPRWVIAEEQSKFDIHFEHKPRTDDFKQGQLRYLLELEEPDSSTIKPDEGDRYYAFRNDILEALKQESDSHTTAANENTIDRGRSKKKLYRAVYRYKPGDEEGYYAALSKAVDEHTWIVDSVNKLLEENKYTEYPRSI